MKKVFQFLQSISLNWPLVELKIVQCEFLWCCRNNTTTYKISKSFFCGKKNLGYIRNWSISNTPQYKMMPLRVQDFLKEIISYKSLCTYILEFSWHILSPNNMSSLKYLPK